MFDYVIGLMLIIIYGNHNADDNTYAPYMVVVNNGALGSPPTMKLVGVWDLEEIVEMLLNKEKVSAIKRMREVTGVGLKEAKDICDRLIDDYGDFRAMLKVDVDQPTRIRPKNLRPN